jgi:hypothetical protein
MIPNATEQDAPTSFELEQWEKDARRLITCGWCGGAGQWFARQYRHQEGEWQECPKCDGKGKRAADLDKLRLINRLRAVEWDLELAKGMMKETKKVTPPALWGEVVGMGEEPAP